MPAHTIPNGMRYGRLQPTSQVAGVYFVCSMRSGYNSHIVLVFFLFCSSPVVLPPPRSLCSVPCVFQSCVYLFIHLDRLRYRRANHQTKCDGEISVNLWSRVQCACRAVRALICRPPNQSNDLTHFTAPICIPSSITIIITYA